MTRGHAHDKTVLGQALATKAGYIGMIGSRRKRDAVYEALLKEGFTRADLGAGAFPHRPRHRGRNARGDRREHCGRTDSGQGREELMRKPPRIVALVLAAGYSSRMGTFKPLAPLGTSTLIEEAVTRFLRGRDCGREGGRRAQGR